MSSKKPWDALTLMSLMTSSSTLVLLVPRTTRAWALRATSLAGWNLVMRATCGVTRPVIRSG
eukprot:2290780-Prymnesium_polylepis.1